MSKKADSITKTRIVVSKRVKKVRPPGYDPLQKREQKRIARSFEAQNLSLEEAQARAE